MSYKPSIQVNNLEKCYQMYAKPQDRLKQFLWRGRRKYFREFWALQNINFEVMQGEVIGIIGRNGSGKSTLLQLICGTLTPSAGDVTVNGRIAALLELGAGFNPEFSGRENVWMSAAIAGLSQKEIAERYDSIVEFSGIADFIDQPAKTYSSGMYMRLAFSVAINIDPDILVIDEALSVGDGAFARQSFDRIMKLKQAGKTILFCSHSIYQVEALCDRAIWLDKGHIAMLGDVSQVTNKYNLSLIESTHNHSELKTTDPSESQQNTNNSHTAKIISVRASVNGLEGTKLDINSQKSTLTITTQFDFDPSLPTPSLGFTFCTLEGICVSSTSTYHDGFKFNQPSQQQKNSIEVCFPEIPLLKGEYTLSVYLACENAIHFYDSAVDIIHLHVTQQGSVQGFVAMPHHWS